MQDKGHLHLPDLVLRDNKGRKFSKISIYTKTTSFGSNSSISDSEASYMQIPDKELFCGQHFEVGADSEEYIGFHDSHHISLSSDDGKGSPAIGLSSDDVNESAAIGLSSDGKVSSSDLFPGPSFPCVKIADGTSTPPIQAWGTLLQDKNSPWSSRESISLDVLKQDKHSNKSNGSLERIHGQRKMVKFKDGSSISHTQAWGTLPHDKNNP